MVHLLLFEENEMINNFIHHVKNIGYKTGDAVSSGFSKASVYAGKGWRQVKNIKSEVLEKIKGIINSTKHTSSATSKDPIDAAWIESKLQDSWTSSNAYSAVSKAVDVSQSLLGNTAETGELPIHMGFPKEGNGNQAKFEGLVAHYSSHPKEASHALKSSRKALAEFKIELQEHYTQRNITLLGRDALNRMLLTDSKFSKWVEDPNVLRGPCCISRACRSKPAFKESQGIGYAGFQRKHEPGFWCLR